MFDDEYMKEILSDEPALKENLDGFTYFDNFSGSYSTTVYSIAHLATGKNFYNEEPIGQWVQDTTKEDFYLDNLVSHLMNKQENCCLFAGLEILGKRIHEDCRTLLCLIVLCFLLSIA